MAPSTTRVELHRQQQRRQQPEPETEQQEEERELQAALAKRVRHRSIADGKSTYFGKYVSFEASEKLRTYEYHGTDHSLIYKHVLTPMNNALVELLPMWLAPNLVRGWLAVCVFGGLAQGDGRGDGATPDTRNFKS